MTDMAQHFHYINKLKGKIAASALNFEESGDRALVLECAIKCADLNNSAKPTSQSRKWAFQVMQEFFLQGDREKKLGMPVSKFMDRQDTNIPKCQIGFIDILVVPLFDSWSQCIQTEFSRRCMENIAKNRSHWESILDRPEAIPDFPAPLDEDFQLTTPATPPFISQPPPSVDPSFSQHQVTTPSESQISSPPSTQPPLQPRPRRSSETPELYSRPTPPAAFKNDIPGGGRKLSVPYTALPSRSPSPQPPAGPPTAGKINKSVSGGALSSWNDIAQQGRGDRERNYVVSPTGSTSVFNQLPTRRRPSTSSPSPTQEPPGNAKLNTKIVLPALPRSTSGYRFDDAGHVSQGLPTDVFSPLSSPSKGSTTASPNHANASPSTPNNSSAATGRPPSVTDNVKPVVGSARTRSSAV
ncbi:hypothetical protein DFS34DRAFT_324898 [Phlyctochytrium arcticum]|nr:hypothetical protein DFS34DRAFT_324898 [Phlyctochytrium arcticum]